MLEIKNWEVWGLEKSLRASGNPMTIGSINTSESIGPLTEDALLVRGKILGNSPNGSAHDHYLLGIHVQFDIKYPQYWTIEAERYHNFEIISSQSKMHRLTVMGKDDNFKDMFNKYVDFEIIGIIRKKIRRYEEIVEQSKVSLSLPKDNLRIYTAFMDILSNLPMGFEMWMTCSLTYLQLKTVVSQRMNHKLKEDWGTFCKWAINDLPHFSELTGLKYDGLNTF
jgi:hypothetical protein